MKDESTYYYAHDYDEHLKDPVKGDVDVVAVAIDHKPTAPPPPSPSPPLAPYQAIQEPLPPSHKTSWLAMTCKLFFYHLLTFIHATTAFVITVTGISLSIGLLPLFGVGIIVYWFTLQFVYAFAGIDVALGNTITRAGDAYLQLRWEPHTTVAPGSMSFIRRILNYCPVSLRITTMILYFMTVKFAIGVMGLIVAVLPLLPFAAEITRYYAHDNASVHVSFWDIRTFNLDTDPEWYVAVGIAHIVVGFVLMHALGRVARRLTEQVCCQRPGDGVGAPPLTSHMV